MPGTQRGVALITVLLVMSLALLITAGMLRSHRLALGSSGQQLHHLQLRQLGLAGEAWGLQRLQVVMNDPKAALVLGPSWVGVQPPLLLEQGQIDVSVEDLAARFNIRPLLASNGPDEVTAQRWQRLQAGLGLTPLRADALAGMTFSDISQLRQVPGVDAQTYARLQPWIVLLDGTATLNINTASATVLATLKGVTPVVAQALVAQRPAQGYTRVEDFTLAPALIGLGVNSAGLGTTSRQLRLTTQVRVGQGQLRLESDVARDKKSGQWRILQRRFLAPTHSGPLP